ncbi:MAG: class I SAM-dependent RNA methyltransferase [Verrucomicrobia bacterium]|nr:class I SAM-dependent RNA methyltransferase [Verrucomicrobiota bacterium]
MGQDVHGTAGSDPAAQDGGFAPEPPLARGDRLAARVTDVAFGGEGVARVNEFVVFVPFVLPGELVELEVTEVKRHFARARLVRVLEGSAERVTPRCPYFGGCGGCQYQHVAYREQLRLKHRQVSDLMERVGGFPAAAVQPVVPSPAEYGYRNRLLVRSQWHKPEQRLAIGFLRHDSRLVVDVEECAIAEPLLNRQLARVRAQPPPRGGLKVALRIQPEGWAVPPDSFFQNNFFALPSLLEVVRAALRDGGARHLVDVYCGVGYFGIELAREVESFVGLEYDRQALAAARQNAAARGLSNGEFVAGTAEECLAGALGKFRADRMAVILDPPRVGCAASALDQFRAVRPRQILYISCHPATQARDLRALCGEGLYRLHRLTPVDMFPQTQHVECVADLRAGVPCGGANG